MSGITVELNAEIPAGSGRYTVTMWTVRAVPRAGEVVIAPALGQFRVADVIHNLSTGLVTLWGVKP